MINIASNQVSKKLAVQFVLNEIDYKKRCQYLQEIIAMGQKDNLWIRALGVFFNTPMEQPPLRAFCKN